MLGTRTLALVALATFASAQAVSSLDPCGQDCFNQMLAKAGSFACAASDYSCLCRVADFGNGIRDCALHACPPGYAATVTNAANAICATATLPPGAPVTTSPTTTPAAPTTTTAPSPTTSASSSGLSSTTTPLSSTSTSLETTSTSTSSSSATAVATKASTAQTSSASAAGAASTSEAPATSDGAGLTEAAKIGIGIGIGAAVIALLAVAACVILRKRRASHASATAIDRFKISHPMPAEDHAYTQNNHSDYDLGGGSNELEMKSRRYEDMLPRQQPTQVEPRQMV